MEAQVVTGSGGVIPAILLATGRFRGTEQPVDEPGAQEPTSLCPHLYFCCEFLFLLTPCSR